MYYDAQGQAVRFPNRSLFLEQLKLMENILCFTVGTQPFRAHAPTGSVPMLETSVSSHFIVQHRVPSLA